MDKKICCAHDWHRCDWSLSAAALSEEVLAQKLWPRANVQFALFVCSKSQPRSLYDGCCKYPQDFRACLALMLLAPVRYMKGLADGQWGLQMANGACRWPMGLADGQWGLQMANRACT